MELLDGTFNDEGEQAFTQVHQGWYTKYDLVIPFRIA